MLHAVTPINMHGLRATHGSMLSAEHSLERYQPLNITMTRCNTPVKNLYLSGNTPSLSDKTFHEHSNVGSQFIGLAAIIKKHLTVNVVIDQS